MKKVKNLPRLLAVIAFVLSLFQVVFAALSVVSATETTTVVEQSELIQLSAIGLVGLLLAVAFLFSKNEVMEKVGYGLLSINAVSGLVVLITSSSDEIEFGFILGAIVTVILLVSVLNYFTMECLKFFGYSKLGSNNENNKFYVLKEWQKLVNSKTLTTDEYEVIKTFVLQNNLASDVITELEEMRKLLDAKLISSSDVQGFIKTINK